MGAWGLKPFENDDALDWVYELEEATDLSLLDATLSKMEADYLESPDASEILGACLVVKALQKGADPELPDEVKSWVSNHANLDASHLIAKALKAIDRVLSSDSELKELFEETEHFAQWESEINQIKSSLLEE